jgi:hypothetical protein
MRGCRVSPCKSPEARPRDPAAGLRVRGAIATACAREICEVVFSTSIIPY